MNGSLVRIFLSGLFVLAAMTAWAQESDWPRTVMLDDGTVTIYAPQVDEMNGDLLRFRSALAWRERVDQ